MGSLQSARIAPRWRRQGWTGAAVAALVTVAGCSGDDDEAGGSTEPAVESSVTEATEPPPETTSVPSTQAPTTTSTTAPPSTTISEEELKAQIAADYQRSWQLRRELTENPTLDNLDATLAQISAPGLGGLQHAPRAFVTDLVTLGERVVPGTPDEFRLDVEQVDLDR